VSVFRRFATYILGKRPEWERPDGGDLLESSPDGMVIVDAEGKIVFVNSQTEALFGYSRQELAGQPVEILIPKRFGEMHVRHRASFHAQPKVRAMGGGLTLFGKRKDGKEFPVDISLSPLRTPQGLFFISAVRDITERKQAEQQIRKLNAELGEALRRSERLGSSGELAADIAKQVEKRLDTLVRLLAQLDRRSGDDVAAKELLEKAKDEVAHISAITAGAIALQFQHENWKKR